MKKFLVLYLAPNSAMEQMAKMTPEQSKKGTEMWMAWSQKAGSAVVDLGQPCGNAKAVAKGTVGEGRTAVRGFSILQGDSVDAITKLMVDHPHLMMPEGTIEVLEQLPIM
ncbi:MAG TPA: hypothetical protein VND93_18180 [Myxococcales bacterium]|jgi:hypothetical protein|nr:hypothetical protein [Myxococcales bacterium]